MMPCTWRCLALLLLGTNSPAYAHDERPTGYPPSANERSDKPVTLLAVYVADLRANVSGRIAGGTRYLDNLDLQVAIDADRLVGRYGARLFLYGLYGLSDNGASLSGDLIGDAQGVSNIETGVPASRLFEARVEQNVGGNASVKIGLYNLNSEFDTAQSGRMLLVSAHGIGQEFAQPGRRGPSIFPVTSLAVRGEV